MIYLALIMPYLFLVMLVFGIFMAGYDPATDSFLFNFIIANIVVVLMILLLLSVNYVAHHYNDLPKLW